MGLKISIYINRNIKAKEFSIIESKLLPGKRLGKNINSFLGGKKTIK